MKKFIYNSVTLHLTEGQDQDSKDFPTIEGQVVGVSSHLIGDRGTKRARLGVLENGTETYRPMDIAFSETEGRQSFNAGIVPVLIKNPGSLTARINLEDKVPAGESFSVEVLIVSEKIIDGSNC